MVKQINTRARGQYCHTKLAGELIPPEDLQQLDEDPYMKAWKDWVERERQRRLESTRRLEKQERLSKS